MQEIKYNDEVDKMAELNKIYRCDICGNVVEVLEAGPGALVCCGQDMTLQIEKTEDEGMEKHVPIIEIKEDRVRVKVGSVAHPMEQKHYISLIEVLKDGRVLASYRLSPNQKPEAEWVLPDTKGLSARIFCNIQGGSNFSFGHNIQVFCPRVYHQCFCISWSFRIFKDNSLHLLRWNILN